MGFGIPTTEEVFEAGRSCFDESFVIASAGRCQLDCAAVFALERARAAATAGAPRRLAAVRFVAGRRAHLGSTACARRVARAATVRAVRGRRPPGRRQALVQLPPLSRPASSESARSISRRASSSRDGWKPSPMSGARAVVFSGTSAGARSENATAAIPRRRGRPWSSASVIAAGTALRTADGSVLITPGSPRPARARPRRKLLGEVARELVGEDRAEHRDADRAADLAEERRARAWRRRGTCSRPRSGRRARAPASPSRGRARARACSRPATTVDVSTCEPREQQEPDAS